MPSNMRSSVHNTPMYQRLLILAAIFTASLVSLNVFAGNSFMETILPSSEALRTKETNANNAVENTNPKVASLRETSGSGSNDIRGGGTTSSSSTEDDDGDGKNGAPFTCTGGSTPNLIWQRARNSPQFCQGTYEHGIFNLKTLEKSLAMEISCGSYCIFIPSTYLTAPSSSLGWTLRHEEGKDEQGQSKDVACWAEMGSFDDCMGSWAAYRNSLEGNSTNFGISAAELFQTVLQSPSPQQDRGESMMSKGTFECDPIIKGSESNERVCGPQILIIGAMKCGTNSIGRYLELHPDIVLKEGIQKSDDELYELHYFTHDTLSKDQDPLSFEARRKYAQMIPNPRQMENTNTKATFDKSTSYLNGQWYGGRVARIAKELLPHAKVIVSVCNPTERMYSHFWHVQANQVTRDLHGIDDFDTLVDEILKPPVSADVNFTEFEKQKTLTRVFYETGMYATHILDWIKEFGRDSVLVTSLDEISEDPYGVAHAIINHVGLDWSKYPSLETVQSQGKVFANASPGYKRNNVSKNARKKLNKSYKASIKLLAELLNDNSMVLNWSLD